MVNVVRPGGWLRRHSEAAALVVVGLALPVVCTALGGAFGIPRNDDWAHARVMFALVRTGHVQLNGWSPTTLVGQLAVAYPLVELFPSRVTLQLLTLGEGLAALAFLWGTARRVMARRPAFLVAVGLAVTPLWIPLVGSFMTDVPAAMGMFGAAYCTVRALDLDDQGRFLPWAAGALGWAIWAVTVRQSLIVTPVVIALALGAELSMSRAPRIDSERARHERRALVGTVVLAAAVLGAILWWRTGLDHGTLWVHSQEAASIGFTIRHVDRLVFSLGLFVIPVLALARPLARARRLMAARPVAASAMAVLIAGDLVWHLLRGGVDETLLGDYATRGGAYAVALHGSVIELLPTWVWVIVLAAAAGGAWMMVMALVDFPWRPTARREPARLLLVAGLPSASLVLMLVTWSLGVHPYDRYLLEMVPFIAVLVLWPDPIEPSPSRRSSATMSGRVVFVACAALAVYLGVASANSDRGRWDAAVTVHRRFGIADDRIDAGLEWVGAHATTPRDKPWYVITDMTQCLTLNQFPRPDPSGGVVVSHTSFLGVDRWYEVASTGRCRGSSAVPLPQRQATADPARK